MTAADKIAEARALVEPLAGYSSGPWEIVTDLPAIAITAGEYRVVQTPNQNNYRHFGPSERWLGIESFSNAALIAAAPALRDTVADLADLAEALAQQIANLREALKRIDSASKFFSQPGHSDDTLRYAHESTGHITAAALGDAQ